MAAKISPRDLDEFIIRWCEVFGTESYRQMIEFTGENIGSLMIPLASYRSMDEENAEKVKLVANSPHYVAILKAWAAKQ